MLPNKIVSHTTIVNMKSELYDILEKVRKSWTSSDLRTVVQ